MKRRQEDQRDVYDTLSDLVLLVAAGCEVKAGAFLAKDGKPVWSGHVARYEPPVPQRVVREAASSERLFEDLVVAAKEKWPGLFSDGVEKGPVEEVAVEPV